MANFTYDPEADAVYIAVGGGRIVQSAETSDCVVLDLDAQGRLIGIEILNASRRLAPGAWKKAPKPGKASAWPSDLAAGAGMLHRHPENAVIDDWIEMLMEWDD